MNTCEKYNECIKRPPLCHINDCKECPGGDSCGCNNCKVLSIESKETKN